MQQAAQDGAALAVFPELGLTGYTCSDLFLQQPLLDAAEQGLRDILRASETLELVAVVGLPVRVDGALYNCAAVVCHGALLGLVPKTHLPNYAEFYELRHFTPAPAETRSVTLCGASVPFGTDLLFRCREMPDFCLGVEICEDLWAPLPPSTRHALAGATVLANLSASDETVGKAEYRRQLVGQQSARLLSAYLYADAGHGESTTDMVFAAHDLICENGALLAEAKPFGTGRAEAVLDLGRMQCERRRSTTFCPNAAGHTTVPFSMPLHETALTRPSPPPPFVPSDAAARAERCELILEIQADGLAKRLEHAHARTAVLGISGGLDSCLALLVAVRAMKRLQRPMQDILAVTMPLLRHDEADALQRRNSVSGARCAIFGNFHHQHRPQSFCRHWAERICARRHVRERTGARAHTGADGSCQPHGRPCRRHGRPEVSWRSAGRRTTATI